MGETSSNLNSPVTILNDGSTDGFYLNNRCWGTYIHGIFDNTSIIEEILTPYSTKPLKIKDFDVYKNEQFDKLADLLRTHIDIPSLYEQIKIS
jgi:adenosylcobyric acid synthase